MPINTIEWKGGTIRMVDQTSLPGSFKYIHCGDLASLRRAIRSMKVRGAPAIGIAGALGILLASERSRATTVRAFEKDMDRAVRYLASSRPTARNLFWALERMERAIRRQEGKGLDAIKRAVKKEALAVIKEDKMICRRMALHGSQLISRGESVLTHCNAGGLATADYGTALGVMFEAKRLGKDITVYVDETRPLLQGARLTTWELKNAGIRTVLICDNMAASLMARGEVDKIFVGADRIAANGDTANKIGTYNLAVLARYHGIPFYVVAPTSTVDKKVKSGKDIPIEERDRREVTGFAGRRTAPYGIEARNPAFDVTPAGLISAIVTEKGILKKPYGNRIRRLIFNTQDTGYKQISKDKSQHSNTVF
jgi:methylthioribose-1-phosphate isomerase